MLLVHSPAFTRSATSTTRRAVLSTSAISVSATVSVRACGVCISRMLRALSASTSKLSYPTETVEVARSFGIFSSSAASTFSLEPSRPSALANASACCATVSGLRFFTRVTVKCSSRRFCRSSGSALYKMTDGFMLISVDFKRIQAWRAPTGSC